MSGLQRLGHGRCPSIRRKGSRQLLQVWLARVSQDEMTTQRVTLGVLGAITRAPFGTGLFIRDFLLGLEPNGAPMVDPDVGAPQADIHGAFKGAVQQVLAEDVVAQVNEQRIRQGLMSLPAADEQVLVERAKALIPLKLTAARYHSFVTYFNMLKRLGWVQGTPDPDNPGEFLEERSALQDIYAEAPPRRFYRLTPAGRGAPNDAWKNPQRALMEQA